MLFLSRFSSLDRGFFVVLGFLFVVRLLLTPFGIHAGDFGSWIAWGDFLWQYGPSQFYGAIWSDRLPGGVQYLVWLLAGIKHGLPFLSHELLYKLPANLADTIIAFVVYRYSVVRWGVGLGVAAGMLYALNPFTWHVSALWGQMDAIQALALIIIVLLLLRQRYVAASILLAYIFLFKPHSIVVAPVFVAAVWLYARSWRDFAISVLTAFWTALATVWVSSFPFATSRIRWDSPLSFLFEPLLLTWERFEYALSVYPYATLHAFNWWMVVQKNWVPDFMLFGGISYNEWGVLLFGFFGSVAFFLILNSRPGRSQAALLLGAATLVLLAYTFLTRVHDKHFYSFFALFSLVLFDGHRLLRAGMYVLMVVVGLTNTLYSIEYQYGSGPFLSATTSSLLSLVPVVVSLLLLCELAWETDLVAGYSHWLRNGIRPDASSTFL